MAGRARTLFVCIAAAAGQSTALVAAPLRVLCYGDSLTAGTSPPLDTLYPYAPALESAIGPSVLVRHRGLPGATAAAMLQCADDEQRGLRSLLRKSSPALAIILAGTNDLGYHSESAPIVNALRGLHEQCHALRVPTLALGIPPSAYQAMQSEAAELAHLINRELRAWCEGCEAAEAGLCGFVEHPISSWSSGDKRWAPDGLHLSPAGYAAVGEGLAGVVVERLQLGSSRR
jgi:lysophospholipase L1-like esterase